VFFALIGCAAAQTQYVWDLLNPYLNAAEVQALLANAKAGSDYPNYDQIPQTNFDCSSKKQSGFYADTDAKCQVFHRCDINGNMTSYLCVNTTVFNQITLVCDYYFNVDCSKAQSFENFANSRLYQGADVPLFDTPPADYETPQQKQQAADAEVIASGGSVQPSKPIKAGGNNGKSNSKAKATTKKPSIGSRNMDNNANGNQVQPGQNKPAKPASGKVTPKATTTTTASSSEVTSQAAEDTTAGSSEATSAGSSEGSSEASSASGEDTTAASSSEGSSEASSASGEDTTAASSSEGSSEASSASGEDTTAAGGDQSASSESGDTTSAGGEDTTTAAAQ
jgi:hypothetical protein